MVAKKTPALVLAGAILGLIAFLVTTVAGNREAQAVPGACTTCHPQTILRASCTTCHAAPPAQLAILPDNFSVPFPHHNTAPGGPVDTCTLAFCHSGPAGTGDFDARLVPVVARPGNLKQYCFQCHAPVLHQVTAPPQAGNCLVCHSKGVPRAPTTPIDHSSFTSAICLSCHKQPPVLGAPLPPHLTTGIFSECLTCHQNGAPPFRPSHTTFTMAMCTVCHQPVAKSLIPPTPTPPPPTPTPTPTPTPVPDASAIYAAGNCALCHGANRQGGIGPAITAGALAGKSQDQVAAIITNGQGAMPSKPASITDAQVQTLAAWLKATP